MTFRHNNQPAIATALRAAISAMESVAKEIEDRRFPNDAIGISDIAREVSMSVDPVFDAVAKTYTDAKPKAYEKIVTWSIDDLLYEIESAEQGEMEYRAELAAECGRVYRSDYDEHNTLNHAQQGIGRRA